MEKTLLSGDVVLVRKFSQKTRFSSTKILPIHNRIIVFYNSNQDHEIIIKRCIAISGDTIQFNKSDFTINNSYLDSCDSAIFPFIVEVKSNRNFLSYIDSSNYIAKNRIEGHFIINSDEKFMQELISLNRIESYKKVTPNFSQYLYSNPITIVPKKGNQLFKKSISNNGDLFQKLEQNNSTVQNNYYYVIGDNWANSIV